VTGGVDPDSGNPDLQLVINTDPDSLVAKDVVRLKSSRAA